MADDNSVLGQGPLQESISLNVQRLRWLGGLGSSEPKPLHKQSTFPQQPSAKLVSLHSKSVLSRVGGRQAPCLLASGLSESAVWQRGGQLVAVGGQLVAVSGQVRWEDQPSAHLDGHTRTHTHARTLKHAHLSLSLSRTHAHTLSLTHTAHSRPAHFSQALEQLS